MARAHLRKLSDYINYTHPYNSNKNWVNNYFLQCSHNTCPQSASPPTERLRMIDGMPMYTATINTAGSQHTNYMIYPFFSYKGSFFIFHKFGKPRQHALASGNQPALKKFSWYQVIFIIYPRFVSFLISWCHILAFFTVSCRAISLWSVVFHCGQWFSIVCHYLPHNLKNH